MLGAGCSNKPCRINRFNRLLNKGLVAPTNFLERLSMISKTDMLSLSPFVIVFKDTLLLWKLRFRSTLPLGSIEAVDSQS